MEDEFTVSWEDGSEWEISWFQEAGCYFAQRWIPEPDEDGNDDGPFIETPGPDAVMVEDLETLEAVMGRRLPQAVRDELEAVARYRPFTDEMRRDWRVESAFGIARLHPLAGWIDTFAPPGHPDPFADHWLPEAEAWYLGESAESARFRGRSLHDRPTLCGGRLWAWCRQRRLWAPRGRDNGEIDATGLPFPLRRQQRGLLRTRRARTAA